MGQALQVADREFYVLGKPGQVIPCTSWTPGDQVCKISWQKTERTVTSRLSYFVSNDYIEKGVDTELSSDFGLILNSVDRNSSGNYHCSEDKEGSEGATVIVLGNRWKQDTDLITLRVFYEYILYSTKFYIPKVLSIFLIGQI